MEASLDRLIDELRLTINQVVQTAERLHAGEPVTLAMRAVLEFLQRNGSAAVPDIARQRRVTRQHIQVIVNDLLDASLVRLEPNPRHKRSSLVALTAEGEQTIERMRERERRHFASIDFGVTVEELEAAAATLAAVRHGLGGNTV